MIANGNLRQGVATDAATVLARAIQRKLARVGVIGLGYVGLPILLRLAERGFRTLGFDTDRVKLRTLRQGKSYLRHIPGRRIAALVEAGRLEPTSDLDQLSQADVLLICVPTPLTETRDPDLSYVMTTAQQIARRLRPGQLVVLESTTFPGTTRRLVLPALRASGLTVGKDYFLAYSPEREDPGNQEFTPAEVPKVVGGIEPLSLRLAQAFYRHLTQHVVAVSNCEIAEATKILENTYRAVNIALVNELKMLFTRMGIDIWEVIDAAKTKPFGFQAFHPGPGLGGHCIPVDPFYLSWLARIYETSTRFIELAGEVNRSMPDYVFQRLTTALNERGKPLLGSKVCLLGIAYKRDVDDPRESPAFVLLERLQDAGAEVSYHDPYIPRLPLMRHHSLPDLASAPLTSEFVAAQDCLLIVTDHSCFDYDWIVEHAPLVIDTRNATRRVAHGRDKICLA